MENKTLPFPLSASLAVLPCILWLIFYLKKDNRPEPKTMVLKVFFFGALITFPVALIEFLLFSTIKDLEISSFWRNFILSFFVYSLVEELGKFFALKKSVFSSKEFDEPVDAMVYSVIVALGFASVENFLYLSPLSIYEKEMVLQAFLFRSLGATFFHTLSSAILGFFIGLSFFYNNLLFFVSFGLFFAILLHGIYDFCIMNFGESYISILGPVIILFVFGILISLGFNFLKKKQKIKKYVKLS
jgi:RsiW-degrading membrane proteinase PrsW (M82 family)